MIAINSLDASVNARFVSRRRHPAGRVIIFTIRENGSILLLPTKKENENEINKDALRVIHTKGGQSWQSR